ncbi:unnamed protein product [Polarella glacialis]|uniref:Methyltransferase FkbM domain-containing protein n=1 Tax=Polarella glacialis TaxID=89957 RepID=A0A813F2Y8_POLGL|nr:unnamed protein product [Polarella glacialis]CAE8721924.1 unnamed protein product [Polarella glacialis]
MLRIFRPLCDLHVYIRHSMRLRKLALVVAVGISLILLVEFQQKFATFRSAYVWVHREVAPLLSDDVSEGQLYTKVLPQNNLTLPKGRGGCVWDVGANNGVWHSNSYYLINQRGFHAWLFEPDASLFMKLRDMYARVGSALADKVELFNMALAASAGLENYRVFPMGFENTIVQSKLNQYDQPLYNYSIAALKADLICTQQKAALQAGLCRVDDGSGDFTVLSIDVEGADSRIIRTAHEAGCRWSILIIESPGDTLMELSQLGYRFVVKNHYNYILVYDKKP